MARKRLALYDDLAAPVEEGPGIPQYVQMGPPESEVLAESDAE